MNKNIFEIRKDYLEIIQEIEDLEGEVSPETLLKLQINESEREQKAEAYVYVIRKKEAKIDECKRHIEHCKKIIHSEEKSINYLKTVLKSAVYTFGKITAGLFTVSTRYSKSIEVINVELLDAKFVTQKTETFADKKAIKEALDAGERVFGAEIVENFSLQIK